MEGSYETGTDPARVKEHENVSSGKKISSHSISVYYVPSEPGVFPMLFSVHKILRYANIVPVLKKRK